MKMFVWTVKPNFVAIAQAHTVTGARALLLKEQELGESGDGSCPERDAARETILNTMPTIWIGENAEFALTDSAELREMDAHCRTQEKRIAALESQLAEARERLAMAAEALFAYGDRNEMTANPWWAIVAKNRMGSNAILAGPFFSRERAEEHRQARLYEYGKGSIVFCFSGHISQHYKDLRAALTAKARAAELERLDSDKT